MNNDHRRLITAAIDWQNNQYVHPLTCGVSSEHPLLAPMFQDGRVVLVCLADDCTYVQEIDPGLAGILLHSIPDRGPVPEDMRVTVACSCGAALYTYDTRSHETCCRSCGTLTGEVATPIRQVYGNRV